MKKTLELFVLDWKRIFKSPIATLLIVALLILPSLYCWFNVWALWDPYSNTQDLKIAVYSDDTGTSFEKEKINVGKELTGQLKKNKSLGWTFVDSKEKVVEGVKSGEYYAGIYVPKNFSKDLLTFINGDIKKPELNYYVNTKINAVAPKITDKGASTIQDQISDQFVTTVGKTLVGVFNKLGVDLNDNLPMLRKFASLLTTTNDNLPTIEKYLSEVEVVKQKMPEIDAKLQEANQVTAFIPEINKLSDKLMGVNQYLPLVESAGNLSTQLASKTDIIYNSAYLLNQTDQNFQKVSDTIDSSLNVLNQSQEVLDSLISDLPDLTEFSNNFEDFINNAKDTWIPDLQAALPTIKSAIKSALTMISSLASSMNDTLDQIDSLIPDRELTDAEKAQLQDLLSDLQTQNDKMADLNENLASQLRELENWYNENKPDDQETISYLSDAANKLEALASLNRQNSAIIGQLHDEVPNLSTQEIKDKLNSIKDFNNQIIDLSNTILNSGLGDKIDEFFTKFESLLNHLSVVIGDINTDLLPKVPELLESTKKTLTSLTSILETVQKDVPVIGQTLHETNGLLQDNVNTIVNGISTISGLYKNEYPNLKFKLTRIQQLAKNDLPRIESEVTEALAIANAKMPEIKEALNTADDFIQNDWPTLKDGIQKGAAAINGLGDQVDIDQLINLLKRDANKEANFLANPVDLKTTTLYPIPTYGSQSAPFYTALCLWVGGLLLSSVVSTEYILDAKQKERYSLRQQYFGRFLTFLVIGLLQALIVSLGNMFLIHTYVKDPVWFVVTSMFIAFSFFCLLYSIVALFGNIGKGIGIIILVLSISGAGGNFPVILSGKFFQAINPFLPFTYAVNGLRETVGGIYWPNFRIDWLFLAGVGIVFLVLGAVLLPIMKPWIEKIHKSATKSMIIH